MNVPRSIDSSGVNDVVVVDRLGPVDLLDELHARGILYAPDYVINGGGVINVTLKSGTNAFRGSVYAFARRGAAVADVGAPWFAIVYEEPGEPPARVVVGAPESPTPVFVTTVAASIRPGETSVDVAAMHVEFVEAGQGPGHRAARRPRRGRARARARRGGRPARRR